MSNENQTQQKTSVENTQTFWQKHHRKFKTVGAGIAIGVAAGAVYYGWRHIGGKPGELVESITED